jgi:hypothetical protein
MDPFILSRNVFQKYCSEYRSNNDRHQTAIQILNQRYEYFLATLNRLQQISLEHNRNINSTNHSAKDTLVIPLPTKNRSKKKFKKENMPRISIIVSCAEHRIKQQM